jgi:hypothetical protein
VENVVLAGCGGLFGRGYFAPCAAVLFLPLGVGRNQLAKAGFFGFFLAENGFLMQGLVFAFVGLNAVL